MTTDGFNTARWEDKQNIQQKITNKNTSVTFENRKGKEGGRVRKNTRMHG